MYMGVIPSIANIYLLWGDRHKPGVVWFILSMATGGAWAFLFATFTLLADPRVTLVLANLFWTMVPTAAVSLFLLAYEFVFKQTVPRRVVIAAFAPVLVLFGLSWFNPWNLIFTSAYQVGPAGFLHFPNFGGPVKIAITKIYGYLMVFFGAGMFVGNLLRTKGIHRRQTIYLLVIFSMLVLSTVVKVAGLVPIHFDPTSVVYSLSGVLFAYSIHKHGLMKYIPLAREQTFQEVTDAILVIDSDEIVVDINDSASRLFGSQIISQQIGTVLSEYDSGDEEDTIQTITLQRNKTQRFFSIQTSTIAYGRGLEGKIVVLNEITELKKRENELALLKQILTRVFRHNIRNDLNVIAGYAAGIKDKSEGDVSERAADIQKIATKIVNQAEKVRAVEDVFVHDERVRWPLRDELEPILENYRSNHAVTIRSDIDDLVVKVHPRFDLAIRELIDNALTHHTGASVPEIDVYTELTDSGVSLVVEDDGPGLPIEEIEVLKAEEESDLEHSSGIGLWLVHWITTRSNGKLDAEVRETGTRIRIHLPRASQDRNEPKPAPV